MTSSDYGLYGVITSYTSLLGGLSDLGFSIVMLNAFYNYPNRWHILWKQLHFYLIVWSFVYGLILAGLLFIIMPDEAVKNSFWIIIYVCIPAMFFSTVPTIGVRYYQFSQKPMYVAFVSAIVGVLSILLNLYSIVYLKMGYMGWFLSLFISSIISFLFYVYPVFVKYKLYPIIAFRKNFLVKNLKVSLPTIPHSYSSYLLNSSDRLVMDRLQVKVQNIGQYNMAYTFGNYFEFFGNAVGMALGPFYTSLFSKRSEHADKNVHFLTHWLQISFICVGFIISLWCKEILNILINNTELKLVYPLAIVIIMGYSYRPYYWTAITRIQYSEKTSQLWKVSLIAGVLNVALNLVFIPMFGIMAACISTFVSLLYMGFSGYFMKAFKENESMRYYPKSWILIISLSTMLVYLIKDIPIYMKVSVSLLLLLIYLWYIIKNIHRFQQIKV